MRPASYGLNRDLPLRVLVVSPSALGAARTFHPH